MLHISRGGASAIIGARKTLIITRLAVSLSRLGVAGALVDDVALVNSIRIIALCFTVLEILL